MFFGAKFFYKKIFISLFLLILSSCATTDHEELSKWMQGGGKVRILSTTAMIDSLVQKIGGSHVLSITLIKGDLDPHSYEMLKGDGEKIDLADLVFYNGLGLEHAPSLSHKLHHHQKAKAVGDFIASVDDEALIRVDGQVDPHVWMDISLWKLAVPLILRELVKVDPKHQVQYEQNAQRLLDEMQSVHKQVFQLIQAIPEERRYLVTGHDGFHYFVRAYFANEDEISSKGWLDRFEAPEGLAPQSQISMLDLRKTLDFVAKHRINILFPESNLSNDSVNKMLRAGKEMGLEIRIADSVLYSDALGAENSGAETYLEMMKHNAKAIYRNLYALQK